jgi:hypothetical protein
VGVALVTDGLPHAHARATAPPAHALLQYHLEEGVVLDSWVENDRRRFLLRAATAADTRQGSNDEEKSDQDWNRKEGSQAWVDLHAGGTAGSTMTVPAHMLMEAWQVRACSCA